MKERSEYRVQDVSVRGEGGGKIRCSREVMTADMAHGGEKGGRERGSGKAAPCPGVAYYEVI